VVFRDKKVEEWKELRNYLFATDTRTTSNNRLPWSNSTTTPKLTQIRDNLHANYMAALFPTENWFTWKAGDSDSALAEKRDVILSYMRTKIRQSGFVDTVSRLVLDWIDTGNCFAITEYDSDLVYLSDTDIVEQYQGPRLKRISPYDITFNPVASSFDKTPKIIRELVTMGDLVKRVEEDPAQSWLLEAKDKLSRVRGSVSQGFSGQDGEVHKADGYVADGFSNIIQYYESGYVELLHFYGDIYNSHTGELQRNRIITVADRAHVLRNVVNPSWNGSSIVRHASWRQRPDNLYGMGPLENLVGLQYRIDHLENMKADVWDQIAYPKLLIQGEVLDFGDDLGERIYLGTEGAVSYLAPDATALNADMQIADLANKMEELAGAPRNAMGIRTPGEKTAFEVQSLDRSASRIFEHKAAHFERTFLRPCLNDMLECGRRNLVDIETIEMQDKTLGIDLFKSISRDDISAKGYLWPVGATHFAERNQRIQNLSSLWQVKMSDPSVGSNLSGKKFAKLMTDELREPDLYGDNIALFEEAERQRFMQELGSQIDSEEDIATEEGL
jgi:hypothetical protein